MTIALGNRRRTDSALGTHHTGVHTVDDASPAMANFKPNILWGREHDTLSESVI